jgi:protein-tyrosine phosphatase
MMQPNLRQILFICTGNYYRSRFSENLFNHHAEARHLGWRATSRGVAVSLISEENGPISTHTMTGLAERGITLEEPIRKPIQLRGDDFDVADRAIAMDEREHRHFIESLFFRFRDRVEYWHVRDIGDWAPERGLEVLEKQVMALLDELGPR